MKGMIVPQPGSADEWPVRLLYESQTTRVFRTSCAGESVVCKQPLGADAVRRLAHEESILGRLGGLTGVAQLAGGPHPAGVLALQDCDGTSLSRQLQRGPVELGQLLTLALQLAQAVAAVHRAGVIHRDLNPANVLLSKAGAVMLIDFDLAMLAEQHMAVVHDGQIVGTLAYLAPEQTGRTGQVVDQRSDLYALGATLYEMATGSAPFTGSDALQQIHDHLVREPRAPSQVNPGVPPTLSGIILRLLAKAPELRYQSAEGLVHDLARLRREFEDAAVSDFEVGERDFPARLAPPKRLVGRDGELAVLRGALSDALHTARRTVLIEGAPGVGKSALIDELRPAAAEAGGWFIYGKFDQYQKDAATAGALTQALCGLGRLILAQTGDDLAAQRRRILDRLGRRAGLITRLSPELALLLGPQPEAPDVDPRQAELHMQQAMADLLGTVATALRPVVLVLDDLQWASALSLNSFSFLMSEPELRGVLLVGAFRDLDVDAQTGLPSMLHTWRQQARPPVYITLSNLTSAGMRSLIGQMLRLAPQPASELARAVDALTGGNPFDTLELINALRREGVLDLREQGWHWEEAAIRRFVGQGDVVDLLAARIGRLPQASRDLLELMSCLGNAVEVTLLRAAAGQEPEALRDRLRAPLEDGLLITTDGSGGEGIVQFRHDRVQQAVLGTMGPALRASHQLAMARRLASMPAHENDAAQQYLACTAQLLVLGDAHEQRRAALLFHRLAQQLARTATYFLAERYLAAAGELLAAIDEPDDDPLRWAIGACRHLALYSLGRLHEADDCYSALPSHSAQLLDRVESTCLQMRSLDMRGRMPDTMQLGRQLLAQLGLATPLEYDATAMAQQLDGLGEWARQDNLLAPATRAQIHDRRLRSIAKLLDRMVRSAYYLMDLKAFTWLLLESQRLWAEHGPCPELVSSLGRLNGLLISLRQDYRNGFEIARHVMNVGQALGFEPHACEAQFMYAGYACHWFEPLETAYPLARQAYDGVRAGGDASFACYVHRGVLMAMMDMAATIDACTAEVESGLMLCRRTGNHHAAALHTCERQVLRALRGHTQAARGGGSGASSFDDEQFNEQAFLARAGALPYVSHTLHTHHAMYAALLGEVAALAQHAASAMALLGALPGYYMSVHVHLYVALARAWQVQAEPGTDTAQRLAELDGCRNWLAARAADQPHNFLHLLLLVEAEQAWALGDPWRATTLFNAALAEASVRQRPWHRALIAERAGLFHLANGLGHTGRKLLADARDGYEAWGASVKVARMQLQYTFLQTPGPGQAPAEGLAAGRSLRGSSSVSPEALDLMGLLRASQALSSETSLEQLAARVNDVLAALSGASKVLVLTWSDGQWWLLAPAPGEPSISLPEAAKRGLLPLTAIGYAERTDEALVVDDALADDRFSRDPYFAALDLCSLLVAPIGGQGTTRAMLLLENRLARAAFNAQRLDAVMLIAGQLAVSLANAQLYKSLEQRVQARTRELEQTQAELVATARRAGKAEIANNVLHNVGNVLNSVNVSASVMRRNIGNSRLDGLARAVDLINEHSGDLSAFVANDPRGNALIGYLNDLVSALRTEREYALEDLDRLARSVDHISYVVATQQSVSGPSSVLEKVKPGELLDEALRLSTQAIARAGVTVARRYEDVPATALDKQRLLQILVNLIGNAAQAMADIPEASRRLTLGISITPDDTGAQLCITVQDEGEGIAPDNLTRIFAHGFTTRHGGHGFGLHSSALAALEMGARLAAHSDGPGLGATFTLTIAIQVQERNP
ncbi:MAG: AAA family ATPase [Burkholderiaceae bacterium]|nr:AAA family ATPase [Burkholderiaceae bacterium]